MASAQGELEEVADKQPMPTQEDSQGVEDRFSDDQTKLSGTKMPSRTH